MKENFVSEKQLSKGFTLKTGGCSSSKLLHVITKNNKYLDVDPTDSILNLDGIILRVRCRSQNNILANH